MLSLQVFLIDFLGFFNCCDLLFGPILIWINNIIILLDNYFLFFFDFFVFGNSRYFRSWLFYKVLWSFLWHVDGILVSEDFRGVPRVLIVENKLIKPSIPSQKSEGHRGDAWVQESRWHEGEEAVFGKIGGSNRMVDPKVFRGLGLYLHLSEFRLGRRMKYAQLNIVFLGFEAQANQ